MSDNDRASNAENSEGRTAHLAASIFSSYENGVKAVDVQSRRQFQRQRNPLERMDNEPWLDI